MKQDQKNSDYNTKKHPARCVGETDLLELTALLEQLLRLIDKLFNRPATLVADDYFNMLVARLEKKESVIEIEKSVRHDLLVSLLRRYHSAKKVSEVIGISAVNMRRMLHESGISVRALTSFRGAEN